jgi:hypothetical protein
MNKREFPTDLATIIKLGDSDFSTYEHDLELIMWDTILIKEKGIYHKYDLESALKFPCKAIRDDIEDYMCLKIYDNKQILDKYNENRNLTNKN